MGRGARLTQVQAERGGFWVLAQTQPGGRATERRLKQHGATRRCEVCKAAGAYQSGELTAAEALTRAGWDRSNEVQRSLLLDIFGLPEPPEVSGAPVSPAAQPEAPTAPQPQVPGQPAASDPELDGVVEDLIQGWATPQPDAQPEAEPEMEASV